MLGHRDIRTTIKFYAGMEMAEAARHYEAVLEELIEPKLSPGRRAGSAWPARGLQSTRRAAPEERAVSGPDWREPQRACLPFARWPAADREGWRAATSKGDFLLDDGPGAALKPLTLRPAPLLLRPLARLSRAGGQARSGSLARRAGEPGGGRGVHRRARGPERAADRGRPHAEPFGRPPLARPGGWTGPGCGALSFGSKPGPGRCGTSARASSSRTRSSTSACGSRRRPRTRCRPPRASAPSSTATG